MKIKKKLLAAFLTVTAVSAGAFCLSACSHEHAFNGDWSGDEASHWHECTVNGCGETDEKESHAWNSGTVTKAATCLAKGEKTYTCVICNKTKTEEISVGDHSWNGGEIITQATCHSVGEIAYECTVCHTENSEEIPAFSHNWNSGTQTKAPNCHETGVKTFSCTNEGCNETRTEDIAVVSSAHVWDEGEITKTPNCRETGVKTYYCTVTGCTAFKTEPQDKTGHNFAAAWSKDSENHYHVCLTDGCDAKDGTASHIWGDWETTLEPTEQDTGVKKHTCTQEGCGAFEEDTVPVLNHEHSYVEGAYLNDSTHHWQVCKDTTCNEPTEHVPHGYGEGVVTKPATALEEGVTSYTCDVCGYVKEEPISKTPAYIVKVRNFDGTAASGVTVVIGGEIMLTDAEGYAILTNPVFADYPMFVQKSGYKTIETVTTTGEDKNFEFTLLPSDNALTITQSGKYLTYMQPVKNSENQDVDAVKITLSSPNAITMFRVKMAEGTVRATVYNRTKVGTDVSPEDFEEIVSADSSAYFIKTDGTLTPDENGYIIVELEVEILTAESVNISTQPSIVAQTDPDGEKFYVVTVPAANQRYDFVLGENVTGVCFWTAYNFDTGRNETTTLELVAGSNAVTPALSTFNLLLQSANGNISANIGTHYDELALNTPANYEFTLADKEKTYTLNIAEENVYVFTAESTISNKIEVYAADDSETPVASANRTLICNLSAGKYIVNISAGNAGNTTFTARAYSEASDANKTPSVATAVEAGGSVRVPVLGSGYFRYYTFTAEAAGKLILTKSASGNSSFIYSEEQLVNSLTAERIPQAGETEEEANLSAYVSKQLSVSLYAGQKVWISFSNIPQSGEEAAAYDVAFAFTAFTEADKIHRELTINADCDVHIKILAGDAVIAEGDAVEKVFAFDCYPIGGAYGVEATFSDPMYVLSEASRRINNSATNLLFTKLVGYKVTVKGEDGKALPGVSVTAWGMSGVTGEDGSFTFNDITHTGGADSTFTVENAPEGYKNFKGTVNFSKYTLNEGFYEYVHTLETAKTYTVTVKYGGQSAGAGVKVMLTSGGETVAESVTDTEGVATFEVFKGTYTIQLENYDTEYAYGKVNTSATVFGYSVNLTAAFTDYSVTLDKFDGTKVSGEWVYLKDNGVIVSAVKTDADGVAEFKHFGVDAYDYSVTVLPFGGLDGVTKYFDETSLSVTLYPEGAVTGKSASRLTYFTALEVGVTPVIAGASTNGFKVTEPSADGSNGAKYTITVESYGEDVCYIEELRYRDTSSGTTLSADNAPYIIQSGAKNDEYAGANSQSVEVTVTKEKITKIVVDVASGYTLCLKLNAGTYGCCRVTVEREVIENA